MPWLQEVKTGAPVQPQWYRAHKGFLQKSLASHGPRLGTLRQDKQISLQNHRDHILPITKETMSGMLNGVTHSAAQRWGLS